MIKKALLTIILFFILIGTIVFCTTKAPQIDFLAAGLNYAGEILSSANVYTYEVGTVTPKNTWIDSDRTTLASNPVILDASGRAEIYADGYYRILVKDSNGTTVHDFDSFYYSIPTQNTELYYYTTNYNDGSLTDETILSAYTSIGGINSTLILTAGNWVIDSNLNIPSNIELKFAYGAYMTIANGITVTINGCIDASPGFRIFRGTGSYSIPVTNLPLKYSFWENGSSPTVNIGGNLNVSGNTNLTTLSASSLTDKVATLTGGILYGLTNLTSTTINATNLLVTSNINILGNAIIATNVTANTVDTGQGLNELYAMNQNVQTSDSVTFNVLNINNLVANYNVTANTVDTGQGLNELYPMNQAVRTSDSVTFNALSVSTATGNTAFYSPKFSASSSAGTALVNDANQGLTINDNGSANLYSNLTVGGSIFYQSKSGFTNNNKSCPENASTGIIKIKGSNNTDCFIAKLYVYSTVTYATDQSAQAAGTATFGVYKIDKDNISTVVLTDIVATPNISAGVGGVGAILTNITIAAGTSNEATISVSIGNNGTALSPNVRWYMQYYANDIANWTITAL